MRRVKARQSARPARVGTVDVRVARADVGRFGSRINRLAPGVSRARRKSPAKTFFVFDLQAAVITPRAVGDNRVRAKTPVGTAFVDARHAKTVFIRAERQGGWTKRRRSNVCQTSFI